MNWGFAKWDHLFIRKELLTEWPNVKRVTLMNYPRSGHSYVYTIAAGFDICLSFSGRGRSSYYMMWCNEHFHKKDDWRTSLSWFNIVQRNNWHQLEWESVGATKASITQFKHWVPDVTEALAKKWQKLCLMPRRGKRELEGQKPFRA